MRRYKYSNWQWHLDGLSLKSKTSGARNHVDSFDKTTTDECAKAMPKGHEQTKNQYIPLNAAKTKVDEK